MARPKSETPRDSFANVRFEEVAGALKLTNVIARKSPVQEIKAKFDFVVSRAVTSFPDFVNLVRKNVSENSFNSLPNGILYLKGGDFDEEIRAYRKSIDVFDLSKMFSEPFFETKKVIYLPVR